MSDVLKDNNCLVIGATGNIGRGTAKAFLQHGASRVVIMGRDEQKLTNLTRDYLDNDKRVLMVTADLSTPDGAQQAVRRIQSEVGELHHVVSSSGPWWDVAALSTLTQRSGMLRCRPT